ncbi:MAG: DUF1573 domain-containing protein [Bacteroidetes bacterium]|nr:DUF1573 domain-containing protein [Bacteroidota bacterium]
MKKLSLILAASGLLFGFSFAQVEHEKQPPVTDEVKPTIDNMDAPDIIFESETVDYGTIPHGSSGVREFKFKNVGKTPLIISNARGSCGCTVPEWPKEPVMPGQSNVIKVSYDTKRSGKFTKTVTLTSNAKTATKVLTIKGDVLPDPNAPQQTKQPVTAPVTPVKKSSDGVPMEKSN